LRTAQAASSRTAATTALKVGTGVAVLPGRSPILVAKQLASLARLAPKRVLPVFGLSPARKAERVAFPVPEGKRGAVDGHRKIVCGTGRCA